MNYEPNVAITLVIHNKYIAKQTRVWLVGGTAVLKFVQVGLEPLDDVVRSGLY